MSFLQNYENPFDLATQNPTPNQLQQLQRNTGMPGTIPAAEIGALAPGTGQNSASPPERPICTAAGRLPIFLPFHKIRLPSFLRKISISRFEL
ncbi:MAG: hypothetical protein IJ154_08465 [Bacteroidales bacterium]|nr:hypothetical protein [Bacteroidales bacterium]